LVDQKIPAGEVGTVGYGKYARPIQRRTDAHVRAASAVYKVMHHAGSFIALVSLPVMLEVMRITRHGDLDLVFSEKAVDCDERFAFASVVNNGCRTGLAPPFSCRWPFTSALVAAAGVKRMAQDGQGELSLGSAQSCLQPIPFVAVHGAQDTGVYGDQTE